MRVFEDSNLWNLKDLLRQIHMQEMALPNFQRNFVWEAHATQELIISVAKGYPAGSLLRLRNVEPPMFPYREFEGVEAKRGVLPNHLVLDGQQRLTSLYQAFQGVGDVRFFINLENLDAGAEFEECIFHHRVVEKKTRHFNDARVQSRDLVMPLAVLGHDPAGGYANWMLDVCRTFEGEERRKREDALIRIREQWIAVIEHYQFPVVTLTGNTSAEAVCTIFETLNRTGIKLTAFELLRARYFARGIDIRELWSKACEDFPVLSSFNVDPYAALQVLSLVTRSTPSCRYVDVLELQAEAITRSWQQAIEGLAKAIDILQEDCGVVQARWLPYTTMLVPLAAVLVKTGLLRNVGGVGQRDKLVRWFWCSSFTAAYDNATDARAARDTRELIAWLNGGSEPHAVTTFAFDPRILRTTTPQQKALYRAVFALLLSHKPLDFHTGRQITAQVMRDLDVDDHHVFPQAFLRRQGVSERARNCVLNRTLIDRATNRFIADRAPSDYLGEIRTTIGGQLLDGILQSHILPGGSDSPLVRNSYNKYLEWRQKAIWAEIERVTGAREASDLVTEEVDAESAALAVLPNT